MKVLKGKYENGKVRLTEPPPNMGSADVEIVFFDDDDQRWSDIISNPTERPALSQEADQVLANHRAGKTSPLDPEAL